jgi:hypothetical protein
MSATSDAEAESESDAEASASTTSTARRWWLTNDSLAWLLIGTFPLILAAAAATYLNLGVVPESVLLAWLGFVGTAVAWTFGTDAIRAWRGKDE